MHKDAKRIDRRKTNRREVVANEPVGSTIRIDETLLDVTRRNRALPTGTAVLRCAISEKNVRVDDDGLPIRWSRHLTQLELRAPYPTAIEVP